MSKIKIDDEAVINYNNVEYDVKILKKHYVCDSLYLVKLLRLTKEQKSIWGDKDFIWVMENMIKKKKKEYNHPTTNLFK